LLTISFTKIISASGDGALAHLPYRDATNMANFYCSMGDTLRISNDSASTWTTRANTLLGLPAVAGVQTPVRAYFGTSLNWITIVNEKEIWMTQDVWGNSSPWRCIYAAENAVLFGLPFNRNLQNSIPFVYAEQLGLYRCVSTTS
jgi:hypothetical protein